MNDNNTHRISDYQWYDRRVSDTYPDLPPQAERKNPHNYSKPQLLAAKLEPQPVSCSIEPPKPNDKLVLMEGWSDSGPFGYLESEFDKPNGIDWQPSSTQPESLDSQCQTITVDRVVDVIQLGPDFYWETRTDSKHYTKKHWYALILPKGE